MKEFTNLLFFALLFLFSACDGVYLKDTLPFSSGTEIDNLPDYFQGKFKSINCDSPLDLSVLDEISISKTNNVTMIELLDVNGNSESLRYKSDVNMSFSSNKRLDKRKLKIFSKGEKIYINFPTSFAGESYWGFIIVEELDNGHLKLTTSSYDLSNFKKNKSYYESNNNFVKEIPRGDSWDSAIVFDNIDSEEFEELLSDLTFIDVCIFKRIN